MKSKTFLFTIAFIAGTSCWISCYQENNDQGQRLPDIVSYDYNIRPILSDKCFKCHGPDVSKQEAGLRLDFAKYAYAPLPEMKGAFAIVPGHPEQSELFKRISSTDSSYMMPLPSAHLGALTPYQIKLFEDTEHMVNLYQAMDRIRSKHGADKIGRAVGAGLKTVVKESETAALTKLRFNKT